MNAIAGTIISDTAILRRHAPHRRGVYFDFAIDKSFRLPTDGCVF